MNDTDSAKGLEVPTSETPAMPEVTAESASAPALVIAPPAPSVLDAPAITAAIGDMRSALAKLASRMDSDGVQLRRKDEIIAEMTTELQQARAGFVGALLRPLFEENVRLMLDIEQQLAHAAEGQPLDGQKLLEEYRLRLAIGLENSGLFRQAPTELDVTPRFDPRTQVLARTIDVDDPAQHQRIARVVAPAFHHEGKALLRERVDVFRYLKPTPSVSKEGTA